MIPERVFFDNLRRVVPRGGCVGVFFAKGILSKVLPSIVKEKKCDIFCVGCSAEFVKEVEELNRGSFEDVDVFLAEPQMFSNNGALFLPDEASFLPDAPLVGVGWAKFSKNCPADLDFVSLQKTVSELGVFSPDILADRINA